MTDQTQRSFSFLLPLIRNRNFRLISIVILLTIIAGGISTVSILKKKHTNDKDTIKTWKKNGITVVGGNEYANELNQSSIIVDFYVDDGDNQTIYFSDFARNRIVQWKAGASSGQIFLDGNRFNLSIRNFIIDKDTHSIIFSDLVNRNVIRWSYANTTDREILLSNIRCTSLYIDKKRQIYIGDSENELIKIWKNKNDIEIIVIKDFIFNSQKRDFELVHLAIDRSASIYISTYRKHAIYQLTKNSSNATVVAGEDQLHSPEGIIFDDSDNLYIADAGNNRIICWEKGAKEGRVIVGGNGRGNHSDQFYWPTHLSFDKYNNLYVVDLNNYRIQKFLLDSS